MRTLLVFLSVCPLGVSTSLQFCLRRVMSSTFSASFGGCERFSFVCVRVVVCSARCLMICALAETQRAGLAAVIGVACANGLLPRILRLLLVGTEAARWLKCPCHCESRARSAAAQGCTAAGIAPSLLPSPPRCKKTLRRARDSSAQLGQDRSGRPPASLRKGAFLPSNTAARMRASVHSRSDFFFFKTVPH